MRYRHHPPNGRWTEARVKGVNKDGSIDVIGSRGARTLRPERLERKAQGPRKATVWLPLTGQETP